MLGKRLDYNHYERVVGYVYNGKVAVTFAYYDTLGKGSGSNSDYDYYTSYYEYAFIPITSDAPASITVTGVLCNTDAGNKHQVSQEISYTKKQFLPTDDPDPRYYYYNNRHVVTHRVYISSITDVTAHNITYSFTFGDGTTVSGTFGWTYGRNIPDGCTKMQNINFFVDGVNYKTLGSKNITLGEDFTIKLDYVSTGVWYDVFFSYYTQDSRGDWVTIDIPIATKLQSTSPQTVSIPVSVQAQLSKTSTKYEANWVRVKTYGGDYTDYTKDLFLIESFSYPRPADTHIYMITPDTLTPIVSISASEQSPSVPSGLPFFVAKRSVARVNISASGQYGATISSIESTFLGVKYNGSQFNTNTLTATGTYQISSTITDSRGLSTTVTLSLDVKNWAEPVLTKCFGYRCAAIDNPTENPDGAFICVKATGSVSPVDNENTMTCTVYYTQQGTQTTNSVTMTTSGYSMNEDYAIFAAGIGADYDVTVVLRDRFTQTTYICARVPATGALLHIKRNKKGLGVFRRAPTNLDGVYVAGLTDVTGDIKAHGLLEADGIVTAQTNLKTLHGLALQQYETATTPATGEYIPLVSVQTASGYATLCFHPADGTVAVVSYDSSTDTATVTQL